MGLRIEFFGYKACFRKPKTALCIAAQRRFCCKKGKTSTKYEDFFAKIRIFFVEL